MEGSKKSAESTWLESYEEVLHRASVRLENLYGRAIGLLEVEAAVGEMVEELQWLRDDARILAKEISRMGPHCVFVPSPGAQAAAKRVLGEE